VTPAARLQAAIDVLEAIFGGAPADRSLAQWGRTHRFAGSKDRAAIADTVYTGLRRRRSLGWRFRDSGTAEARAVVLGAVLAEGSDAAALFDGQRHGPAPLTPLERRALAVPADPMPDPVRLDYPDWLDEALRESLGAKFEASMQALQQRAPVDLRVNTLKADREEARGRLAEDSIIAEPLDLVDTALRAPPASPVAHSAAYQEGLVELQDAASQAAAAMAAAAPGETVLDFCAGGGGKTLALAAQMGGTGRLIAHDAAPRRMGTIPDRAMRAGATVDIMTTPLLRELERACDVVFVDAPCSGSGSWRRDPGGKWRLTADRLTALPRIQAEIVAAAARYCRPGGRLVYVTCSMLRAEAEAGVIAMGRPPRDSLRLTPAHGHDGFQCALW
jgi:16S rRNA (cytosine967-C5)-methyltransferase